jgi:hypothetical protein
MADLFVLAKDVFGADWDTALQKSGLQNHGNYGTGYWRTDAPREFA